MARLFAHPQKFCFAEVSQVNDLPMACNIFCYLEKHWFLTVTNMPLNSGLSAVSYAFLWQPRSLVKRFENAPANSLLQSLLDWRGQVLSDLGLEPILEVTAETYFEKERSGRMQRRHSLLRKSIIWGLLKMIWFSIHPKSEWLGDYAKFKVKR